MGLETKGHSLAEKVQSRINAKIIIIMPSHSFTHRWRFLGIIPHNHNLFRTFYLSQHPDRLVKYWKAIVAQNDSRKSLIRCDSWEEKGLLPLLSVLRFVPIRVGPRFMGVYPIFHDSQRCQGYRRHITEIIIPKMAQLNLHATHFFRRNFPQNF